MAKGVYIRGAKLKGCYIGINGVSRKVKEIYIGINGAPQKIWSASTPPVFTIHPQDQNVEVNQTILLTADATGDPTPTISWEKSIDGINWVTF